MDRQGILGNAPMFITFRLICAPTNNAVTALPAAAHAQAQARAGSGKRQGSSGKNGPTRRKATEDGGVPRASRPAQETWGCGCKGLNADRNFGWRLNCVACDSPQ